MNVMSTILNTIRRFCHIIHTTASETRDLSRVKNQEAQKTRDSAFPVNVNKNMVR